MDAFFASVEQRDNPSLKGRPLIVSGRSKRSVVSTASYEARQYGIHSAMPVFMALQKCPHVIIMPGNMKKYRDNSARIMDILSQFSPRLQQVSIDEAFLDITGCARLFGSCQQMAETIKKAIFKDLSLTCSIGAAPLKFLAKIASDMKKPEGLTIIEKSQVSAVIDTLPIEKVPGVGRHAHKHLTALQIRTLGDVNRIPVSILSQKLGKAGYRLHELASGKDSSKVSAARVRKSISSETTLPQDIADAEAIRHILLDRAQHVGRELREKKMVCRNVFIKIKFSDFKQVTRSMSFDLPIHSTTDIFNAAVRLFEKVPGGKKIRLAGVGVGELRPSSEPVQMDLLMPENTLQKHWEQVDSSVDAIARKFGSRIVTKASLTPSDRSHRHGKP